MASVRRIAAVRVHESALLLLLESASGSGAARLHDDDDAMQMMCMLCTNTRSRVYARYM